MSTPERASTASVITDEQIREIEYASDVLRQIAGGVSVVGGTIERIGDIRRARGVASIALRRLDAVLSSLNAAPTAQPVVQKPYAYCVYIAAEQRGELVYDLEDAMDDLSNCECEITELFDHPPAPAAPSPCSECSGSGVCDADVGRRKFPFCEKCAGTGRAALAASTKGAAS